MLIGLIILLPFIGAFLSLLLRRKSGELSNRVSAVFPVPVLLLTLALPFVMPEADVSGILVNGLHFTTDGFRAVYAIITAVMWVGTSLFSLEYFEEEQENIGRYWFFVLVTFGATEGVMLSADLMTAFVFFEILSFTSFTWVIHEETGEAIRAGYTYLFIAVIGGLVLFMGLLMMQNAAGTLMFGELASAVEASEKKTQIFAAGLCILFGFGAKAGMVPVHVWLPKAHPAAPSPASALLSGILTKVGVYGILMMTLNVFLENASFGKIVLVIGEITMFLGAFVALFSVNLKRTLACSSMSQIGFILTGLGMTVLLGSVESEEGMGIALSGLMLHMTNHSLIKLTLFMCAGVAVMNLHSLKLDDLRGWGRNKLWLKISFALGALGISGVPLFNGFISKTLLHEGIVEGIHECHLGYLHAAEWVFLVSGGFTFAYMLKLFICIFVEKNSDPACQAKYDSSKTCMNRLSTPVIFGSSLLCVILGQPAVMTRLAAFMTANEEILHFRAFTFENLKGGFISLGIGALVYLIVVRKVLYRGGSYVNLWPEKLDLEDAVYRPVLTKLLPTVFGELARVFGENRILIPVAKFVLFAGTLIGRILVDSSDAILMLLRKTIMRERKSVRYSSEDVGLWWKIRETTTAAIRPITQNFTFAMFMTCCGLMIVFVILFFSMT